MSTPRPDGAERPDGTPDWQRAFGWGGPAASGTDPTPAAFGSPRTPAHQPALTSTSRWRSDSTSFGPVGRVLLTLLSLLPLVGVAMLAFDPFAIGGVGIYLFVLWPRILRDIWKRARVVHLPPP